MTLGTIFELPVLVSLMEAAPALTITWAVISLGAIGMGVLLALQGWENGRFVRANFRRQLRPFEPPHVAVVVPVKGLDAELAESLGALMDQDYPSYELHFVGENRDDPAYGVIESLTAQRSCAHVHWHSAGLATDSGQKIHNLERALDHITDKATLVAFADSDARPDAAWLRNLTYRLAAFEGKQGATTGYRVLVPARPTICNWLLYSINAAVGGLMVRSGPFNIIWGGAWIVRRELLEPIRQTWRKTVIDDVLATRVVKQSGWRVGVEPRIVVPTLSDTSPMAMMEFLRRQFFMVFHYSRRFWIATACCWTLMVLGFWGNAALALAAWAASSSWWWLPAAVAGICYAIGAARVVRRQQTCRVCLPELQAQLRGAQRFELLAHPVASLVGWAGMLAAAVGRTICWRGITYGVGRRGQVCQLTHPTAPTSQADESRAAA